MRQRNHTQNPLQFKATRVQHVILVTSGASEICANGHLDRIIQRVLDLKKTPILVLGPEGDEILLASRLAESCDLAFDPNYAGGIFSGIQAGLHAATGPAFIFPLSRFKENAAFWQDDQHWQMCERGSVENETLGEADVVCFESSSELTQSISSDCPHPFPQVISTLGAYRLLKLPAQTAWGDPAVMRFQTLRSNPVILTNSDGHAASF